MTDAGKKRLKIELQTSALVKICGSISANFKIKDATHFPFHALQ